MRVLRGMPLDKRRQLEQLAAGFLAEAVPAPLPSVQQPSDQAPEQLAGSGTNPGGPGPSGITPSRAQRHAEADNVTTWRTRLADLSTWPVFVGMFGGLVVTGVMFESGVDSDATDPTLWAALLACCGLGATGLTAFLDRPRSRGQAPVVGLIGLAGLIAIPLFWATLTPPVPLQAATTAPKLRTTTVGQTVRVGALRIRVTQMTCGYVELAGLPPADRGQYCVADLTATNLRSYPDWLYDAEQGSRLPPALPSAASGWETSCGTTRSNPAKR
jgi:hypothetical protein